jgi:hypothetical protein
MKVNIHKKEGIWNTKIGRHIITLNIDTIPRIGETIFLPYDNIKEQKYKVKNVIYAVNQNSTTTIIVLV